MIVSNLTSSPEITLIHLRSFHSGHGVLIPLSTHHLSIILELQSKITKIKASTGTISRIHFKKPRNQDPLHTQSYLIDDRKKQLSETLKQIDLSSVKKPLTACESTLYDIEQLPNNNQPPCFKQSLKAKITNHIDIKHQLTVTITFLVTKQLSLQTPLESL